MKNQLTRTTQNQKLNVHFPSEGLAHETPELFAVLDTLMQAAGFGELTDQRIYMWRKALKTRKPTCKEVERAFWSAYSDPDRYGKLDVNHIIKHLDTKEFDAEKAGQFYNAKPA